ncbi:MAG: HAMP domain-containing histidine kinase [Chlamydiae bacterium]|nr:HAMP domain-containing histidine kinase [Chlamydiota bacterium]MBI3277023.1 HAMP domain-containing histidine kinase [Chlamydiota bacterium]
MISQQVKLSILGMVLGLGSPLGWMLIRLLEEDQTLGMIAILKELSQFRSLYIYLTIGTIFFFSIFGYFMGHLLQKVVKKDGLLEAKTQDYMRMVSFVAHELKTPLTSVKGRIDLVLMGRYGEVDEIVKENLIKANFGCDQINEMISVYLNLARIERGELNVKISKVDIYHDVILPVIEEISGILEGHGMRIQFQNFIENQSYGLDGDSQWLKVVFRNLFANAIRYGYRDTAIEVRLNDANSSWKIEIFNLGYGIPLDYLEKIFERFEKVPRQGEMANVGTGLGLYIVKAIVEQHLGKIRCESELGKWANFILNFPKMKI